MIVDDRQREVKKITTQADVLGLLRWEMLDSCLVVLPLIVFFVGVDMQFIFQVKLKEAANTCFHHHLEVVEIVGYRGHQRVVKIVMFLIKTAVSLKKIVINTV